MIVRNKTSLIVSCVVAGFVVAALYLGTSHGSAADPITVSNGGTTLTLNATPAAAGESPATLDQWLALAMDKNPGILASKAKVAMAEAESRSIRFEAARQVVECWNEIDYLQRAQQRAIAQMEAMSALQKRGVESKENVDAATSALIDLKAKLARAQSELRFLGGQAPPAASVTLAPSSAPATVQTPLRIPRGPMVEKVRAALRAPTQIEFVDTPLKEVIDYLKDMHHIEIQIDSEHFTYERMSITLNMRALSLAAAMQLMEDRFEKLKFVVRDYGILITTPARAQEAGYMPVVEYVRTGSPEPDLPGQELVEARKRLAELAKAMEAGGTDAELKSALARLRELKPVLELEGTYSECMEATQRLREHPLKPGKPTGTPAAAPKPHGTRAADDPFR